MAKSKSKPADSIAARFEFRQDAAKDFCPGQHQTLVELRFESVEALVDCVRELEAQIANVTASVNGKVIDLRNISGEAKL